MKWLLLQDAEGQRFTPREKILYVLMALFWSTFFLPGMPVINNIAIGVLCFFCLLYNGIAEKVRLLRQRPALILIFLFWVVHTISAFVSANRAEGIALLQLRSPLLLFPLCMGSIAVGPRLKNRVLLLYAGIATLAAFICLVYACLQYWQTGNAGLLYNDSLTTAIGKQSVYFALMINLAVFSYIHLLLSAPAMLRRKRWVALAVCFLVCIQFMLASRIEITFLVISAVGFIGYYFFVRHRSMQRGLLLLTGLLAAAVLLVHFFPKTINRFREIAYPQYEFGSHAAESHYNGHLTPDQWNGMNIRLAIWQCGWELSQRHLVLGVSVGDKQDSLMGMYKAKGFDFAASTNRNMHSNYLDLLAAMGITGLLLFLAGYFLLPLRSCFLHKDATGALMLTAFMASLITETYLDRSMGCILLGFFVSFIIGYQTPKPTGYPLYTA